MPPVVASDTIQISMLGRWTNGRPVVNVLHFRIDAEAGSVEIEDEVQDVVQNWQSQLMDNFANNYTFEGARWMDLRSLDGDTGVVPPDPAERTTGDALQEAADPSTSILVHKNVTAGRSTRSGRMYLPAPPEGQIDENGVISGANLAGYNADMAAFLANTTQGGIGEAVNRHMVVLHSDGSTSRVSSLVVDPLVANQRRRLRR